MNWKGCGRKRSWPNKRHYPGIFLEGLRKSTKNLSWDSRSPGRDLNPGPPEYKAGVLTTRKRRSVIFLSCPCAYTSRHEDVSASAGTSPRIHNLGTRWKWVASWSVSRPGRITSGWRNHDTDWIGAWVGPRASLDMVAKRKINSCPFLKLNPSYPARSQSLTDRTISLLILYLIRR
jgi:hypothetical protein